MKIFKPLLAAAAVLALASSSALAYEPGTFILRGGVGTVAPDSKSLSGEVEDAAFYEACLEVDDGTGFLMGGTYMFNENWAIDVLAALPIEHDIDFELYGLEIPNGDLDELADVSGQLGSVEQLPPTLSVQYHFAPDATFQPYFGVGLNWTTFSSEKLKPKVDGLTSEELEDILGFDKFKVDDSYGIAAQLGGDWMIGDHTVVNFDVRYMDIDSDLMLYGDDFEGGKMKAGTLNIDPWVYSVNLGYQF